VPQGRQGLQQANYAPRKTVPIRPIYGVWSYDPARDAPPGSSPDMQNCVVVKGLLSKRPGYRRMPGDHAGFGEPVVGLFATQDVDKVQYLYAATLTKIYRYDFVPAVWTQVTGPALTGASDNLFSWENSQAKVVFSQGVDHVKVMDFAGASYADLSVNAPAAKYLCRFNGRLNLAHTREGTVNFPYRHRRPVRDNHTDWNGLGAGFRDQSEFPYHIQNMKKLGSAMILYYEQGIEAALEQANAAAPFRYEVRATDIGVYSARTLAGWNQQHFFLGGDDFYGFTGLDPQKIGLQVRDEVFRLLNPSRVHVGFGEVLPATTEYSAFLVGGGSVYPDHAWVFNWGRGIWYKWTVSSHRCSAIYRLEDPLTIDELVGLIDEQNFAFDDAAIESLYPALVTGGQNGFVYRWSPIERSDDGASIPAYWTSHDFTAESVFNDPGVKLVLESITVEYVGIGQQFPLEFSFSLDGGTTWIFPVTVMSSVGIGGFRTLTVSRRVTGNRIRFKMAQDSAVDTFQVSKFEVEFTLDKAGESDT